ncbi:MAG: flagellar filament capping protein FliD [Athalassotoga sp.]|uniref:flagellar filament capping protein FliD n=1 Tax=Athalassotoga sp. TaxID=2022597 RepID=UPI003D03BD31
MNINGNNLNISNYLSMPISMSGVASGVNWQSLISQMMSVSEKPLNSLQAQLAQIQNEQNVLENQFKPMLENFRESLLTLELPSTFLGTTASLSSPNNMSVVTTSNAIPGSYQIKIDNLATFTTINPTNTVGKSISPSATLSTLQIRTPITAGFFTINGVQINVNPSTESLDDVINSINSSAAGVTASYSASTDTLVLTGNSNAVINIGSSSDTSNFLSATYLTNAPETLNSSGDTTVSSTTHLGAVSTGFTLSQLGISSGSISINGFTINVNATQTLSNFISQINSSNANVTAWYDPNADKVYLKSNVGGPVSINVSETNPSSPTGVLTTFGWANATQTTGQNAQIDVSQNNGTTWTTYTSSTNKVTNAIPGAIINLYSPTSNPVTLTISQDTQRAVNAVQNFVNSFNNIVNWINTQYNQQPPQTNSASASATASGSAQGVLYQNQILNQVLSSMKKLVYQMVPGLTSYNSFPSVGITTGAVGSGWYQTMAGTLSFDPSQLVQALQNNAQQVYEMFANDPSSPNGNPSVGTGIIKQFDNTLYQYTQFNGIIDQYASNQGYLGSRMISLNEQIYQTAVMLKQQEEMYITQYTAMEQAIASLSGQGNLITSTVASFTSSNP